MLTVRYISLFSDAICWLRCVSLFSDAICWLRYISLFSDAICWLWDTFLYFQTLYVDCEICSSIFRRYMLTVRYVSLFSDAICWLRCVSLFSDAICWLWDMFLYFQMLYVDWDAFLYFQMLYVDWDTFLYFQTLYVDCEICSSIFRRYMLTEIHFSISRRYMLTEMRFSISRRYMLTMRYVLWDMFLYFQTLYVDTDLLLCDCPGLVFPSFVTTKAQLVISGILPVDQMREHLAPVSLISFTIQFTNLYIFRFTWLLFHLYPLPYALQIYIFLDSPSSCFTYILYHTVYKFIYF